MKTPRDVYGRDFADHLIRRWEYRETHQTGSHIILRSEGTPSQTLPIPDHKPLLTGTLAALLRMVSEHKGVARNDILRGL
jgi:predicted RNA binding protein YcfA (HicA-like mRNA interferase family)